MVPAAITPPDPTAEEGTHVDYVPSDTMRKFHSEDFFIRSLMGPIGSGKSVACCVDLMKRATEQRPLDVTTARGVFGSSNDRGNKSFKIPDDCIGVRRSRWVIIRNTYRELVDTTMQTFFDWFPQRLGTWRAQDMKWTIHSMMPDGTLLHAEFLFRALDKPGDIKKLLSLELTGGWINEAREVPRQVFDMLQGRVGRYPPPKDEGPSWFGVILDTNPPDKDHWWYNFFEEKHEDNAIIFKQPSGKSDIAENINNLPPNYYDNMEKGKDKEWVNVYVHGKYGFVSDGKPIWPEYSDDVHVAKERLEKFGGKIYVGVDFGLTPAAVFGQLTPAGQMQIIDELVTFDMGAVNFGKLLKEKIQADYCGCEMEIYGDPAGEDRVQTDEDTPFMVLWALDINIWPTYTNDFTIRREVIADYMTRLTPLTHEPCFLICPEKAPMFRRACAGGYKYKRLQVSGQERYQDIPDKHSRYSHVGDGGQYLFLGAVGGERIVGGGASKGKIDYSRINRKIV